MMYRFNDLPQAEQDRARERFVGAGQDDGYLYEVDGNGQVVCRRRAVRDVVPCITGGQVLICDDGAVEFDLYGSRTDYELVGRIS